MLEVLIDIIRETWWVTARMGSWLLLGFLVAGILSVFISPVWLERHLGGRGMGPVWRASLFGVPLPLCSCGVIPVAASLKQHGASRSATTAFLLSTPQTGVDSILVTWTLLGPLFAVFRPIAALLTGLLGGGLVQAFDPPRRSAEEINAELSTHTTAHVHSPQVRPQGPGPKLRACLNYGFVTLPADIGRALLFGLIIAGLMGALIPVDSLVRFLGSGALSIALMMIVGIPIYVCATASVPLAASFIFLGATPGAALAFLIAGPATNAATVTTVARVLGKRTAFIYLLTVAISAFGGGLLLDWLMPRAGRWIPLFADTGVGHGSVGWFDHLGGALLIVVMTGSWWISRRRSSCCG
ncbi:MAG: SO_0444 family Cu/Zn efflux transporter [Gemmatimonadales bacterium]|nr:SO_0444 family Cu/Zn efflux transporter [Gemmatimonadales bacterium]